MPSGPEHPRGERGPPLAGSAAVSRREQRAAPAAPGAPREQRGRSLEQQYGPLLLARERKQDGRALIVYRRAAASDRARPA